jgi:hypothetical protein
MATTGFWPVKGQLKKVLDYADNPKKTSVFSPDTDLAQALEYTADCQKTGQLLFVHGINTLPEHAYEDMMATKRRFGKLSGNIAYHGYQSFRAGEVTPEEAHQIGLETARRMWGWDYQVLVTTHLNTDNLHNHFVVNSVSFRDGKKFLNKKSDHIRLREISDEICASRQKSVLKDTSLYGGKSKSYWAEKAGLPTHREILKMDVQEALRTALNLNIFESNLKKMGYTMVRSREYRHISVKAPGWKRAVRLDKLGFTNDYLQQKLDNNLEDTRVYWEYRAEQDRKKETPLFGLLEQYTAHRSRPGFGFTDYHPVHPGVYLESAVSCVQLILVLLCAFTGRDCPFLEQILGIRALPPKQKPLSPEMRQELTKLNEYDAQVRLLATEHIETDTGLENFISKTGKDLERLEQQRQALRNKERRTNEPEKKAELRKAIKTCSAQIAPLRKKKSLAEKIRSRSAARAKLLESELNAERAVLIQNRDRGNVR